MSTKLLALTLIMLFLGLGVPALKAMDIDWAKLERGEIQTAIEPFAVTGTGMKRRAVGASIINAPVEEVWKVLLDWDAMGEYVPGLVFYKTVHQVGNAKYIAGRIKVLGVEVNYPMHLIQDGERYIQTWRMLSEQEVGDLNRQGVTGFYPTHWGLKAISGDEKIEPYKGNRTFYLYSPVIESKIPVPKTILNYAAKLSLPGYMKAIKERVESHGQYKK